MTDQPFADGTPPNMIPATPAQPGYFRSPSTHRPVRTNEGPRGAALRASVPFRYAVYCFMVFFCSGVAEWGFSGRNQAGLFMLGAATLMVATGAIATWFYPASRREVMATTRHYVFGISLFPGTAVAVLYHLSHGWLTTNGERGVFVSLTANALPLVFFSTVVIPAIVFIGQMAGRRFLERSRMDDQEAVALWTRQDGMQR